MGENNEILEAVLAEFGKLAAIPRQSGHEQAVSDFLRDYLSEAGFRVVQDEVGNIIADAPATAGLEKAPLTILQGHMDMVCVAEEGYDYDPQRDAIKLLRDEKYLQAEGTSLGADDGIGVAEGLYLLKNGDKFPHGPLRLIVTVDEERGMTGAIHLDKKYLEDAAFLINCDSENWDELTVGSAGNVTINFERELQPVLPTLPHAFHIGLRGLLGGHSGERIGDGRGNALRTMALALLALQKKGRTELASFIGGKARNAIPRFARAVLVTELSQADVQAVLEEELQNFLEDYGGVDPGAEFTVQETEMPAQVLQGEETRQLLRLLTLLHTGVYAMSPVNPGLVETSANIGMMEMTAREVRVQFLPRSAIDQKVREFSLQAEELAALTGFKAVIGTPSPGWKENKDSRLAKIMAETFAEQNGKPMKVETIHAGLECGWHFQKNPRLDIVSIGVTTTDIHSPREKLELATVEPQVRLIMASLGKIAKL